VQLHAGEIVSMDLAERGTRLSNNLWVREIRKRTARAHQSAILRKSTATLSRLLAKFGATNMTEEIEVVKMERWIAQKAQMQEEIEHLQGEVSTLKVARKATAHHVKFAELSSEQKFRQLRTHSKQLVDTIKMISFRAETAMANILRPVIKRPDEARTLLRALYATEADLIPDLKAQTLTVHLHHMAQKNSDLAIQKLCEELNATETVFLRTSLRLILKLGSK
jgi:hypothetical protein